MSKSTQASAPVPLEAGAGQAAARMLRIDPAHANCHAPLGLLAWTEYVQPPAFQLPPATEPAAASTICDAPSLHGPCTSPFVAKSSRPGRTASPAVTAARAADVSRLMRRQPKLPARDRDRDLRAKPASAAATGVVHTGAELRRQRFYPEQWRRQHQSDIERLVTDHGQRLQWIGWDRSLPQLYLPARHLTRVILDLLQVTLRKTHFDSARELSMCLRVGWQIGVTQALVLVLEHPQLKLPAAALQYVNAPLAQPIRPAQRLPDAGELVRVRALLRALGGGITATRSRDGGTEFRVSLPVDDRTTLVRAWLEQSVHAAVAAAARLNEDCRSLAGATDLRPLIYQAQVGMFVVGRRQAETLAALDRADARLHSLAGSGDFVYRAARSRWLWLTMHSAPPALARSEGWQSQLIGRWSCLVEGTLLTEQQTAAFHGLARAIVAKMDRVVGRRVPPLDALAPAATQSVGAATREPIVHDPATTRTAASPALAAPRAGTRHWRVDRGAAPMATRPSQQSAHASLYVSTTSSKRQRRWRYPI